MSRSLTRLWTSPTWRTRVEEWIDGELETAGLRRTGPTEQPRVRFWSTQLTVPTNVGRIWFKQNNPAQAFEARLHALLLTIVPEYVIPLLAIEPDEGWMLMYDEGPTFDDVGGDESRWAGLVRDYAVIQRSTIPHREQIVASGLPLLMPHDACAYALDRAHVLNRSGSRLSTAELTEMADALTSGPIPASLEHNDLYAKNAFPARSDGGRCQFFDFGDAVWAHPFSTLHGPIGAVCQAWETGRSDPRVRFVVDAYLDAWSDLADRPTCRSLLDMALRFGAANRFFSWQTILPYADRADLEEIPDGSPMWLDRFLSR